MREVHGVRRRPVGVRRLLRWYPPAWRSRYGDELLALMEDELGGRSPSLRLPRSPARAGLRLRLRRPSAPVDGLPRPRIRSGALAVLCAWSTLLVGGAAFAKSAEHFSFASQRRPRCCPGRRTSQSPSSGRARLLVAVGAVVALPAVCGSCGRGWTTIRRPLVDPPPVTSVALAAATVALAHWAHQLDVRQRNGDDSPYSAAFLAGPDLAAARSALWTSAVVATARRIDLQRPSYPGRGDPCHGRAPG